MPYTHKAFVVTVIITATAAVLSVGLAVGGSISLSLYEAHQESQRLCDAFSYFIHKPTPPINTPAKQRQQDQYNRLVEFENKLGCHIEAVP